MNELRERWNLEVLLSRRSDLLLAALVVGIVGMMIVPLPTPLLDVLLTTNIAFAVIIVLVSLYISHALRIATFPTILLLATLFRLGLNVSSTRLILLQADAGEVIYSFGSFVVGGNLVVGLVVFLILTIIQFVVIAKGSERVAEVAARFTLDAMPGKQMAIDADLRAGAIDLDEARRLRAGLQRESQLYGSMDGAMKFVKGDAIAAILITIINIVAGLLIGVLQRGMAVGEAAALYSLLTVGDGLVSQIPALLTSIAAGIVVTRVASEDATAHLGADIGAQILAHPRAIGVAAVLLVLLALIPGLPTIPFLLLGAGAGAVAFRLRRRRATSAAARGSVSAPAFAEDDAGAPAPRVVLEVGAALDPHAEEDAGRRLAAELLPGTGELLRADLGLALPPIPVRRAADIAPRGYRIVVAGVPLATGDVPADSLLALESPQRLLELGVQAAPDAAPGVATPVCRVPRTAAPALAAAGVATVDPATQIALHVNHAVRGCAFELLGIQETQDLLDELERTHPALVHEVVPRLLSVHTLSEVLRRLVDEGISVGNLREILQSLAEWATVEKDPVVLAEHARAALQRYITHKHAGASLALRALLLDPAIEDVVRDSIQRTAKGSYLAIEPELSRDIVRAVLETLRQLPGDEPPPVVLTTMEIRRYVRRLLEVELPELAVLSYNELRPAVQVQPVARVSIG